MDAHKYICPNCHQPIHRTLPSKQYSLADVFASADLDKNGNSIIDEAKTASISDASECLCYWCEKPIDFDALEAVPTKKESMSAAKEQKETFSEKTAKDKEIIVTKKATQNSQESNVPEYDPRIQCPYCGNIISRAKKCPKCSRSITYYENAYADDFGNRLDQLREKKRFFFSIKLEDDLDRLFKAYPIPCNFADLKTMYNLLNGFWTQGGYDMNRICYAEKKRISQLFSKLYPGYKLE